MKYNVKIMYNDKVIDEFIEDSASYTPMIMGHVRSAVIEYAHQKVEDGVYVKVEEIKE